MMGRWVLWMVGLAILIMILPGGASLASLGATIAASGPFATFEHSSADAGTAALQDGSQELAQAKASLRTLSSPSCPVAGRGWVNSTPCTAVSPSGRRDTAMVWDARDGYVLLFGGYNLGTFYGGTWEFSGGKWSRLLPSGCTGCPSARGFASITYDSADREVLLFGGWNLNYLNDTWKFVGGSWYELGWVGHNGIPSPSPREMAQMTFDPVDNYTVLFGGWSGTANLGDTWRLQAGNWTELSSTSGYPVARELGSMTWDAANGEAVLFGGCENQCTTNSSYQDTWTFRGGTWTRLSLTLSPRGRWEAASTYDSTDGYVLLYGGRNTTGPFVSVLNDTWSFLDNRWTNLTPEINPASRWGGRMASDTTDGYVVLFGGINGSRTLQNYSLDTWEWKDLPQVSTPDANLTSVDLGRAVTFNTTASGGGGTYRSFHWRNTPAGPSCQQSVTALISCTPTTIGTGFTVSVNVTDSVNVTSASRTSAAFTVYADPVLSTPTPTVTSAAVGEWFNFTTTPSGGIAPFTYTWTASSTGLGCIPANATHMACHPLSAGSSYTVTVSAVDRSGFPAGPDTSASFTVLTGILIQTPQVTPLSVDAGQWLNFSTSASGGSGSYKFTWSASSSSLGCVLGNLSTLPCHPSLPGSTYTASVIAKDSNGWTSTMATSTPYTVLSDPSISIPIPDRTSLDLGSSVTFNTGASGGTGSYTFQWFPSSGGLGCTPGVVASSITCVPTSAGSYTIEAKVTDSSGFTSAPLSSVPVTVFFDPALTAPAPNATTITVGSSVTFHTTPSGGTGNYVAYHWSESAPSLQCALGTTATITCVPTAAGSAFTLTVNVTDSSLTVSPNATSPPFSVISSSGSNSLVSVALSPASVSLDTGGSFPLLATPTCSNGACPSGSMTYAWSMSSDLGTFNTTTGREVTFIAGSTSGTVVITVTASFQGVSKTSTSTLVLRSAGAGRILGLVLWEAYVIVGAISIVLVAMLLLVVLRRMRGPGVRGADVSAVKADTPPGPGAPPSSDAEKGTGGTDPLLAATPATTVAASGVVTVGSATPASPAATNVTFAPSKGEVVIQGPAATEPPTEVGTATAPEVPATAPDEVTGDDVSAPSAEGHLPPWPMTPLSIAETSDVTKVYRMAATSGLERDRLLVLSPESPSRLAGNFGLAGAHLWRLSRTEGSQNVPPGNPDRIGDRISRHLEGGTGRAVVLTGLDRILDEAGPRATSRLLQLAIEIAEGSKGTVLVALDPGIIPADLRRRLEVGATVLKLD